MIGPNVDKGLLVAIEKGGLTTIEGAFGFHGGDEIYKPNLGHRTRIAFTVTDGPGRTHELYMKRYAGDPLADRLRRWWTYGSGTSPAAVEFANIQAVRESGILTAEPIIYKDHSDGIDSLGRCYLIVAAVPGLKLEQCMEEFLTHHAGETEIVESFTRKLAKLTRTLHEAGFVHRDLYSSHIFLHEGAGQTDLYLIDLARAFKPKWRKTRWRVKDLAQLKFSPPMRNWADRYWPLFLREYLGADDESQLRRWHRRVEFKIALMRYRHGRKARKARK